MGSTHSHIRILSKILRSYGLVVVTGRKHMKILKDGKRIYSFAGTPGCAHFAENTLRDLAKLNYIPESARQKIR